MIGKIIAGSSFAGTVGYGMKEQSRVFEAEDVNPPRVRSPVEDFKDHPQLNPQLKNTVGHTSLSFSPKDAPRINNALMTQIAKKYMQKMGITDTFWYATSTNRTRMPSGLQPVQKQQTDHFRPEHQDPQRQGLPGTDQEIRIASRIGKKRGTSRTVA